MGQKGTVLGISSLHSGYGMIRAIKDISIHVDKGELVSLLDANDTGKSTLLKPAISMVHTERGSVKYQEGELVGKKSYEVIPMGISIVPEGRKTFANATVIGNLVIGSYTRAADKALGQRILDQVFEFFPRLAGRKTQVGGIPPGDEQQMLVIRRVMMSDPKLFLLDKSSMDLVPLMVKQVLHIIEKLKRIGIAILLMEQNIRMAIKVNDHSYVLNTGETAGKLDAFDGANQDALLETYLGKNGK